MGDPQPYEEEDVIQSGARGDADLLVLAALACDKIESGSLVQVTTTLNPKT
jgi:hypothetical protein